MKVKKLDLSTMFKSFLMWISAPSRLVWEIGNDFISDQSTKERAMWSIRFDKPFLYRWMVIRNFVFRAVISPCFTIFWFVVFVFSWFWPIVLGAFYEWLLYRIGGGRF
jgi:hypothetical protein